MTRLFFSSKPGQNVIIALLAALLPGACGCINTVRPPADVQDPVTVYVANHGRHSSLLLPMSESGRIAGYVQYSYGDWLAFARNHNSWPSYGRALLFSHKSALGRRVHDELEAEALRRCVRAVDVEPVVVERAAAQALLADLEATWHARAGEAVDNPYVGLTFIPYRGQHWRYSIYNNCNHSTSRWLARMGCEVTGLRLLSDFRVRQR